MKLGKVITRTEPETVYNALRLALYARKQGDEVDKIQDARFDVQAKARKFLEAGGRFFACGTCLKIRNSQGSEICPLSTLKDHYEIVRDSDRLVTV